MTALLPNIPKSPAQRQFNPFVWIHRVPLEEQQLQLSLCQLSHNPKGQPGHHNRFLISCEVISPRDTEHFKQKLYQARSCSLKLGIGLEGCVGNQASRERKKRTGFTLDGVEESNGWGLECIGGGERWKRGGEEEELLSICEFRCPAEKWPKPPRPGGTEEPPRTSPVRLPIRRLPSQQPELAETCEGQEAKEEPKPTSAYSRRGLWYFGHVKRRPPPPPKKRNGKQQGERKTNQWME
ncbi:uncharacterized protein LOC144587767 [Pogona vitticeps]